MQISCWLSRLTYSLLPLLLLLIMVVPASAQPENRTQVVMLGTGTPHLTPIVLARLPLLW
jgi:hypothetical protein